MPGYTLTELGPYRQYSDDPHIHEGVVVGGRDRPSNARYHVHAAVWDGGWTLLPDPQSGCDWSIGLEGHTDRVVGFVVPQGEFTNRRAALWQRNEAWSLTLLPMPTNAVSSAAVSSSSDGATILGQVHDTDDRLIAARWRLTGGNWDVTLLPQTGPRGIAVGRHHNSEDIFGSLVDGGLWRAVRWKLDASGWTYVALQLPVGDPSQIVTEINRYSDQVAVGAVTVSSNPSQAAYWDAADQLQLMNAGDHTFAFDHNGGQFVGVDFSSGLPRGFVWNAISGREEIHPVGWDWSFASSIDRQGRITGVMGTGAPSDESQPRQLFLLTP